MTVRFSLRAAMAAGGAALVTGALLVSAPAMAAPGGGDAHAANAPDKPTAVAKVAAKAPAKAQSDAARTGGAAAVAWPAAGSADSDTAGAGVTPGGLPVRVFGAESADAAPRTRGEALAATRQKAVPVRVTVADQGAAAKAGVRGVLLQVARNDGRAERTGVGVAVGYAKFADAYGANYASRLRMVALPACALTTPDATGCQAQTPVAATNDPVARTMTAQSLPVGATASVLALTAAGDGQGDDANWTATDLSSAYSWAQGEAGGDFTMQYPLDALPGVGGPEPKVALGYSSGSVDGKTAAKTGQSSVIGEGWDLGGGGFFERSFRSCLDDGGTTPDNCWTNPDAMTMVFDGTSAKLIKDGSGVWHASDDNKLKIDQVFDSSSTHNNAQNGEYWRVTTLDGTQYYFGKVHRYAGDTADTASVLTEPVIGNNANDPCYGQPNHVCYQAYRWMLDYVVDGHGNSMTYFYNKFVANYGFNNNQYGAAYDLSARLERIEYGTRAGSEASATAPVRMAFTYAERCWNNCNWPTSGYADTPTDLVCQAASCPNVIAPVHFTRYRLAAVSTQVYLGDTWYDVDKWDLEQTFLTSGDSNNDGHDDTAPNLWLAGVTRTGYDTSHNALAEPEVTFGGTRLANRTDWSAASGTAPFNHWRISTVNNGVGGQTVVQYLAPDCVNGAPRLLADADANPARCFPQYFKPPTAPAGWGYFNKYVVASVTEKDLTGGSPDEVTSYAYSADGSSDTALWGHDDVDMGDVNYSSWADWRGYPTVTVTHGAVAGQQTVDRTVYHRGLHGDAKTSTDGTQTLFAQRPAFTLDPLQHGAAIPVSLAGGTSAAAQCVDIKDGVNADGTQLRASACNGLQWQQWQHNTNGSLQNPLTGKCVDVKSSGTANGTQVWLYTCNGGPAQVWQRQVDGSLKNPNSGRCLDVSGGSISLGGPLQLWDCNGLWSQVFMPTGAGELRRSQAVRCAGAAGTADGSTLQSQQCNPTDNVANQTWQLKRDGTIVNPATGKCMDIIGGGTGNNTGVQLLACGTGAGQQWAAQADGTVKNPASGRCLDAEGSAGLFIYDCSGRLSQIWVGRTQDHSGLAGQVRSEYQLDGGAVRGFITHRYDITLTTYRAGIATPAASYFSYMTREKQVLSGDWIDATGSWRLSETDTTYDAYGLPTDEQDWGEVGNAADDRCTHTDYNRNVVGLWYLVDLPSQIVTTDCAASPADAHYLSGTQNIYDLLSPGGAPKNDDIVETRALTNAVGTTLTWTKQGRATYDANGRVLDRFDALEHKTSTTYNPTSGGPLVSTAVTNALGQTTTTYQDYRGDTSAVQGPNPSDSTSVFRDQLGRMVRVLLPHGGLGPFTYDLVYAYTTSNTAPNAITTTTRGPNDHGVTSTTLYDGRLRERQAQQPAAVAKGGRIVADTQYDARGLAWQQTRFWDGSTAPGTALAGFTNAGVNQQTRTQFDARERTAAEQQYAANVLQWQTTTAYDGNSVTENPPAGGTPTKKTLDARGNVVELRQYTSGTLGGASQATTYEYDHLGRLTKTTDPAGNKWTATYDRLGRRTGATDPDAGTTAFGYDVAGNLTSTTDGRNITLAYSFDELNRKTGMYDGTTAGPQRAGWAYDSVRKGALSSSTRYAGGLSYITSIDSYDVRGRPTSTTVSLPLSGTLPSGGYTTSRTYNPDGSVHNVTYPAAGGLAQETVQYTYDDTGHPLTVVGADTYVADTSYYGLGSVYQQVLGSGTKQVRRTSAVEESTGRVTGSKLETQSQTTPGNWDTQFNEVYAYDPAGNMTSAKELDGGGNVAANQCFAYDGLRELTEAWTTTATACQSSPSQAVVGGVDSFWTSYQYQITTGNRTKEIRHASAGDTTRTYTYPASGATSVRPHAVTQIAATGATTGTDSYGYDSAGHTGTRALNGGPNQTLTWDNEGRLGSVTDTGGTTTYTYDADGNRLVSVDPQGTTVYVAGYELRLQSATTTCTRHYGDAAARTPAGVTWFAADPHGTADVAVDATTLSATHRRLDPFGNPRAAAVTWPTLHGFVDGIVDGTGLIHLGAREYEPSTGRFLSDDPVTDYSDPLQLGGYGYGSNNPPSFADPNGAHSSCIACSLVRHTSPRTARNIVGHMCRTCSLVRHTKRKTARKIVKRLNPSKPKHGLHGPMPKDPVPLEDETGDASAWNPEGGKPKLLTGTVQKTNLLGLKQMGTNALCATGGGGGPLPPLPVGPYGSWSECFGYDSNGLFHYRTTVTPDLDPTEGGLGIGAGVGVKFEASNAKDKNGLGGKFGYGEAGAGPVAVGIAGGTYEGDEVVVVSTTVGGGLPANINGGVSDTTVDDDYIYIWPWADDPTPTHNEARKLK